MNKEYIEALEDSNNAKADRIDRLGEMVERLVAELENLRNLLKMQSNTIENLQSKVDDADLAIKDAERYRKLRDLEWDGDSHPRVWDQDHVFKYFLTKEFYWALL